MRREFVKKIKNELANATDLQNLESKLNAAKIDLENIVVEVLLGR